MTAPKLTEAQRLALMRAERDGAVFATALYVTRRGNGEIGTNASTIRALVSRHMLSLHTSSDGGWMGKLTDAGRAALKDAT